MLGEHGSVKRRHEWRALTTGSHVTAAEIGHHRDPGQLCQQGRVVQLQRVGRPRCMFIRTTTRNRRLVAHGLSVCTDGTDGTGGQPGIAQQLPHHAGIALNQFIGGQAGQMQFIGPWLVQCQQPGAQVCRYVQVRSMGDGQVGALTAKNHAIEAVE